MLRSFQPNKEGYTGAGLAQGTEVLVPCGGNEASLLITSQSRVTAQSVGDVLGRIVVPCLVLTFSGQSKTRHCLQTCYVV